MCVSLPLLREVNVLLRQDGQDLVQDLVWIGLIGQSHVILSLEEETDYEQNFWESIPIVNASILNLLQGKTNW